MILGSYWNQKVNLAIVHGAAEEEAKMIFNKIKGRVKTEELIVTGTGPAMGSISPGLIGITFVSRSKGCKLKFATFFFNPLKYTQY